MRSWTDRAVEFFAKKEQNSTVNTDETPQLGLSSVSSVQIRAVTEDFLSHEKNLSAQDGIKSYSELWCYPNSTAMNTSEIAIFQNRISRFKSSGLDADKSEELADRLCLRDREKGTEERISCLECRFLTNVNGWYCKNWQQSKVCIRERDAFIGTDLIMLLQRCDGFQSLDS